MLKVCTHTNTITVVFWEQHIRKGACPHPAWSGNLKLRSTWTSGKVAAPHFFITYSFLGKTRIPVMGYTGMRHQLTAHACSLISEAPDRLISNGSQATSIRCHPHVLGICPQCTTRTMNMLGFNSYNSLSSYPVPHVFQVRTHFPKISLF